MYIKVSNHSTIKSFYYAKKKQPDINFFTIYRASTKQKTNRHFSGITIWR